MITAGKEKNIMCQKSSVLTCMLQFFGNFWDSDVLCQVSLDLELKVIKSPDLVRA